MEPVVRTDVVETRVTTPKVQVDPGRPRQIQGPHNTGVRRVFVVVRDADKLGTRVQIGEASEAIEDVITVGKN